MRMGTRYSGAGTRSSCTQGTTGMFVTYSRVQPASHSRALVGGCLEAGGNAPFNRVVEMCQPGDQHRVQGSHMNLLLRNGPLGHTGLRKKGRRDACSLQTCALRLYPVAGAGWPGKSSFPRRILRSLRGEARSLFIRSVRWRPPSPTVRQAVPKRG